ncbi:hypothetical protein Acr_17g0009910 [Actinidia rufa]|uniref:Uncharacterized protein n=1 Tax=Actinidia rufa TaxID=165716 RepID=A0A7J0G3R8_9ERIC|nr:hypothetical protein Acr_17g0009910 [Actinidia rufa]
MSEFWAVNRTHAVQASLCLVSSVGTPVNFCASPELQRGCRCGCCITRVVPELGCPPVRVSLVVACRGHRKKEIVAADPSCLWSFPSPITVVSPSHAGGISLLDTIIKPRKNPETQMLKGQWEFPIGEPDPFSVPRHRGYAPVRFNGHFWRRSDRCSAAISAVNSYRCSRKVSDLLGYDVYLGDEDLNEEAKVEDGEEVNQVPAAAPLVPIPLVQFPDLIILPSSDSNIAVVESREVVKHSYSRSDFNKEEYATLPADEGNVNTAVAEAREGIEGTVDGDRTGKTEDRCSAWASGLVELASPSPSAFAEYRSLVGTLPYLEATIHKAAPLLVVLDDRSVIPLSFRMEGWSLVTGVAAKMKLT